MNIHNFTARQLCEYQLIFPNVAALLDHLLFTIGNGYDVVDGMVTDGACRIDEYPLMSQEDWDSLIAVCHNKEREFSKQWSRYDRTEEDKLERAADLEEKLKKYYPRKMSDLDFTEEALLANLREMKAEDEERYVRPYPLSERYSDIYNLNSKTPRWFMQIALNLCNAWATFLREELDSKHVWVKISLRPKTDTPSLPADMAAELTELLDLAGGSDYKEPERDYGDEEWTRTHLHMIDELCVKLKDRLEA